MREIKIRYRKILIFIMEILIKIKEMEKVL